MELTRKKLIIIGLIGAVIAGFATHLILYMPLAKKIGMLSVQAKILEAELIKAENSVDSMELTKRKVFPVNENDTSLAIDELTKQAKLYNVNISSMTLEEIKTEAEYGILPVDMTIESEYREVGMFLGSLDELQRSAAVVSGFSIEPYDKDLSRLKAGLKLSLYVFR